MVFNANGAVISGVIRAEYSPIRDDYVVIWDLDNCPIHIKRSVIDYLATIPVNPKSVITNTTDVFI